MSSAVILATSAASLAGKPTGVWVEEVAAPYYAFKQAGYRVTLASPTGGAIPVDGASRTGDFYTPAAQRFDKDDDTRAMLAESTKLSTIDPSSVDIVFVAGGHGAVADLGTDPAVAAFLVAVADNGRGASIAAVCHGVVALLGSEEATAKFVKGKRLTGFSDAEEAAVGKVDLMGGPDKCLEARLRAAGGLYTAGPDWSSHIVVDGKLVTGQNPQSSADTAAAAIKAAGEPLTPGGVPGGGGRKRSVTGTGPERVEPVELAKSAPLAHPPSYHSPRRPPI